MYWFLKMDLESRSGSWKWTWGEFYQVLNPRIFTPSFSRVYESKVEYSKSKTSFKPGSVISFPKRWVERQNYIRREVNWIIKSFLNRIHELSFVNLNTCFASELTHTKQTITFMYELAIQWNLWKNLIWKISKHKSTTSHGYCAYAPVLEQSNCMVECAWCSDI